MDDYKIIPITKGYEVKVDAADYDWLSQWKWSAHVSRSNVYAARNTASKGTSIVKMHRLITNAPPKIPVDHRNHDTLDNRRTNLRICTVRENRRNIGKGFGVSRYIGVSYHPVNKNWMAKINNQHLGSFADEVEAALQYDRAAQELFGEFAGLNFPAQIEITMQRPFKQEPEKTSLFRGVSICKQTGKWIVFIADAGKRINLGRFEDEVEAAKAYDEAAFRYHGVRAKPNFPAVRGGEGRGE